jgi:hypothetical protein
MAGDDHHRCSTPKELAGDGELVHCRLAASLISVFHASPGVKHSSVGPGQRKVVTPATQLVLCPTDGNIAVVTKEECTDSAVPNEKHVAFAMSVKDSLHFAHDAGLSIGRALPAANALIWIRKEFIGHAFKFDRCQKACRGTIILVHFLANFEWNTQGRGQWFRGLQRLSLGAGDNQCRSRKPSGGNEDLNACCTDGTQALRLHRNMWINLDLRVCQVAHECCHPRMPVRSAPRTVETFATYGGVCRSELRRAGCLLRWLPRG